MARPKIDMSSRRAELIRAATAVFSRRGYRQTQMSDIAAEMGVSPGSLYNYVDSKDTLFGWVLAEGFGLTFDFGASLGPLDIVDRLKQAFDRTSSTPLLDQALGRARPEDPAEELRQVTQEYYDFVIRFGDGLRVIEKSALDFPELGNKYFNDMRLEFVIAWQTYIGKRVAEGSFRPVGDIAITTRSVIEHIAFWALHRVHDATPSVYDQSKVRDEVVSFVVHCLMPKG